MSTEGFNSTTVQLILKKRIVKHTKDMCFNSTTVQLIRNSMKYTAERLKFQFHNGTINTQRISRIAT